MADLWPKVWFSIWRRPPSWILRDINFAGKTSCIGPHFLSLCRIWCKSVQKWPRYCRLTDLKMAAAAILKLNLLPVTISVIGPLWAVAGDVSVKFYDCSAIYGWLITMVIWKFWKFGLKRLFPPQNLRFWGILTPNIIIRHRNPQKAHPRANPRRLMYISWKSVHPFLPRDAL